MRDLSLALHFPARVPWLYLFGYLEMVIVRIIVLSMCLLFVCRIYYDLLLARVQSIDCCEKVVFIVGTMCENARAHAARAPPPRAGMAVAGARCPPGGARGPARRGNQGSTLRCQ